MPAAFPETDFRAFGRAATTLFPPRAGIFDQEKNRRSFDRAWKAVRYRYRSCVDCNEEFRALLVNPSKPFQPGWSDEGSTYELERCIYLFFMSGLSVFDSLAFCLYFVGHATKPNDFSCVASPRKIDRKRTSAAFRATFPQAALSGLLVSLQSDPKLSTNDARFVTIDTVRNLVGHRLSGQQIVQFSKGTHSELWDIPGLAKPLTFDNEMLQRRLDDITQLLTSLISAARQFAESHQPAQVNHDRRTRPLQRGPSVLGS